MYIVEVVYFLRELISRDWPGLIIQCQHAGHRQNREKGSHFIFNTLFSKEKYREAKQKIVEITLLHEFLLVRVLLVSSGRIEGWGTLITLPELWALQLKALPCEEGWFPEGKWGLSSQIQAGLRDRSKLEPGHHFY